MTENLPAKKPVDRLKMAMNTPTVREQFANALGEGSNLFVASLIDLYSSDKYLQECEPGKVIMEALKAATLKLPINKNLGFAYVIAYKGVPGFQLGYKGLIQLAMRTGQYRYINADKVHTGELKKHDKMTGELELGEATGPEVIGYFAFIETISGFRKALYWTREQVEAHGKRFSQSWNAKTTPWKTDFDAMAIKTVLKALLGKYGIMSVEMAQAFSKDQDENPEATAQADIDANANGDFIDIKPEAGTVNAAPMTPEEMAEIQAQEAAGQGNGPGW